jgi:hypothetical protein
LAKKNSLGTVIPSLSFNNEPDHRKDNQKGLEDTNNKAYDEENIAQAIASYLPSGLPVDKDVMKIWRRNYWKGEIKKG